MPVGFLCFLPLSLTYPLHDSPRLSFSGGARLPLQPALPRHVFHPSLPRPPHFPPFLPPTRRFCTLLLSSPPRRRRQPVLLSLCTDSMWCIRERWKRRRSGPFASGGHATSGVVSRGGTFSLGTLIGSGTMILLMRFYSVICWHVCLFCEAEPCPREDPEPAFLGIVCGGLPHTPGRADGYGRQWAALARHPPHFSNPGKPPPSLHSQRKELPQISPSFRLPRNRLHKLSTCYVKPSPGSCAQRASPRRGGASPRRRAGSTRTASSASDRWCAHDTPPRHVPSPKVPGKCGGARANAATGPPNGQEPAAEAPRERHAPRL